MISHKIFKIALTGGTQINENNAKFYEKLGEELVKEGNLVIITGGFKCFVDKTDIPSADWSAIKGALSCIDEENADPEKVIETFLPELEHDWSRIVRFNAGKTIILKNTTLEARRFSIVHNADAVVSIQGSKGTRQIIDLAFAINKPILPLPFTGGISEDRWLKNIELIKKLFPGISISYLESIKLQGMTDSEIRNRAKSIKSILLDELTKRYGSQFFSCFISYSSKDEEFVRKVYADLTSLGVRCWYAPSDLAIGAKTRNEIINAIYKQEKLLLVLSKSSVESQWVEHEVETALQREREENRLLLLPIHIDNYVIEKTTGWATYLRQTRNIGDFSKWSKDEFYKTAIQRLLRDLKQN